MSRPIYPALVGEGAGLGRSKTGDNQQRDDQRHEAGSSHEGTSRLMIDITNVTWDGNATARPPAGRPQCTNVANGTSETSRCDPVKSFTRSKRSCGGHRQTTESDPKRSLTTLHFCGAHCRTVPHFARCTFVVLMAK